MGFPSYASSRGAEQWFSGGSEQQTSTSSHQPFPQAFTLKTYKHPTIFQWILHRRQNYKWLFAVVSRVGSQGKIHKDSKPSSRGSEATLSQHLISQVLLPTDTGIRGNHLQPSGNPAEEWKRSLKSSQLLEFYKCQILIILLSSKK